ncbi:MAG: hypothetical protein K0S54_175 [Alphaproteobacteria bacterium]|jgi:hypothetical protein|nr:hypothetical protein [Alphaproteobacteria bacterium]
MSPQSLLLAVVALSLFNGLFSPFLVIAYRAVPLWLPYLFPGISNLVIVAEFVFYIASLAIATSTLLISGVPAALTERVFGIDSREATLPMYVWLAAAAFLSTPAVMAIVG